MEMSNRFKTLKVKTSNVTLFKNLIMKIIFGIYLKLFIQCQSRKEQNGY